MTMKNPIPILGHRTDCIVYHAQVEVLNEDAAGWIGGNAPAYFDDENKNNLIDQQIAIHIQPEGLTYFFYLSLLHPFNPEKMISIFVPTDYDEYVEHNIYPDCVIKVIEHPISPESSKDIFTHPSLIKHSISQSEVVSDLDSMESPFLIKVGGTPRLIQQEDYYTTELQQASFSFFFQVDEEGYPETLLAEDGSYPFGFGALYVYAKIDKNEIMQPVAGFWQFS